ncbi:MAG TPA: dodecin family protein [Fontimonas sp.]
MADQKQKQARAVVTEVIASSPVSFDDAIRIGLGRAQASLENISGAWVENHRIDMRDGEITAYQVTLKLSFEADAESNADAG